MSEYWTYRSVSSDELSPELWVVEALSVHCLNSLRPASGGKQLNVAATETQQQIVSSSSESWDQLAERLGGSERLFVPGDSLEHNDFLFKKLVSQLKYASACREETDWSGNLKSSWFKTPLRGRLINILHFNPAALNKLLQWEPLCCRSLTDL